MTRKLRWLTYPCNSAPHTFLVLPMTIDSTRVSNSGGSLRLDMQRGAFNAAVSPRKVGNKDSDSGIGLQSVSRTFVRGLFLVVLFVAGPSTSAGSTGGVVPIQALVPSAEHGQIARAALRLLDRSRSGGLRFKDDLGARVLQRFIEAWDPERDFLLSADIREFERYRGEISDAMRRGDMDFAFEVFRRVRTRLEQRTALTLELLDVGFDFERNDYLVTDVDRRGWAGDWATLREHWRRLLKNEAIELLLAGLSPSEVRETLRARYQALRTRVGRVDAGAVVERLLDTYAGVVDRHGGFLSPRAIERLRTEAGGVLDGIGVILRPEGQHAVVRRLVPGGPADRSRALGIGDRILGIGAPGAMRPVDVVGWPIHDVVQRLRGPKDTAVRLRILPAGNATAPRTITLVRDRMSVEDRVARGRMLHPGGDDLRGFRIGVIEVPSFYASASIGSERGAVGAGDDVRRLVRSLRAQRMDGLVLDLRRNRGGSLNQAVRTAGLFITAGPIVQIRTHAGETQVRMDPDTGVEWDGPLTVLVGPESASAAEIVAAAMQDYRRGLVVGERTHGKGTTQGIFPLNGNAAEGALRLTVSRWYRVTGETIERRGVHPDLELAWAVGSARRSVPEAPDRGRWNGAQAVQWRTGALMGHMVTRLRAWSRERTAASRAFRTLREEVADSAAASAAGRLSLHLEQRRARHEQRERRRLVRMRTLHAALPADGAPAQGTQSLPRLRDALTLDETVRIAADLVHVQTSGQDAGGHRRAGNPAGRVFDY